jgi:transforming growth factor-beta-induced protein
MKKHVKTWMVSAIAISLFTLSACKKDENPNPDPQAQTIAEIAAGNPDFSILVDALTRTGLLDAVSDPSAELTVFAPTNDAFVALLGELGLGSLDAVEAALGTDGLRTVVLYHVLGAEVKAADVTTGYAATLAVREANQSLSLYLNTNSGVKINSRATVTTADVDASNGVIHIIDRVILPLTIYELLEVNPQFSALTTALGVADGDLDGLTSDPAAGPFTLFAPQDESFVALLQTLGLADLNALVGALGTDGLADVLLYHVVAGNVRSTQVPSGLVPTVNGENISINLASGVQITDANSNTVSVTTVDIQGTNGVIHIINGVLLP